jgi:hypothetical protein
MEEQHEGEVEIHAAAWERGIKSRDSCRNIGEQHEAEREVHGAAWKSSMAAAG